VKKRKKVSPTAAGFAFSWLTVLVCVYVHPVFVRKGVTNKGNKMQAKTAEKFMALVGTNQFNSKFPASETVAYPATGKPLFRPHEQLDHWAIKPYFSQQKAALVAKIQAQLAQYKPVMEHGPAASWFEENADVIRAELKRRKLDHSGLKGVVAKRLVEAVKAEIAAQIAAGGPSLSLGVDDDEEEDASEEEGGGE
jgi:hypothetical protein